MERAVTKEARGLLGGDLEIRLTHPLSLAGHAVLDSLSESDREFSLSPDDTAKRRADTCYPTLDALHNKLGDEEWAKVQNSITNSSDWFRASVWVTIGTTQFTLYSLLVREGRGPVRTILRSFGSE